MYTDFTACFTVPDSDHSPNNEYVPYQSPFDQTCFIDLYSTPSDQSLESFLGHPYLDWLESSVRFSSIWDDGPACYPAQLFGEVGQGHTSTLETIPVVPTFDIGTPITPSASHSSTSPFCSGAIPALVSSPLSSSSERKDLRKAPPLSEESAPKQPQRKRGRPRLDRKLSRATPAPSSNAPCWKHCQHTSCQPHVQVERKYREGLNSDLERLRRAVPTLLQSGDGAVMGQPKPSKAMVLSCAVAYIAKIEHERDRLRERNKQLGSSV
jgi:hypothetical protein